MTIHRTIRILIALCVSLFLSWGGNSLADKLPGLSIDQFWDKAPATADDYRKEGFVAGYQRPTAKPERSVVLNKDLSDAFVDGWKQGQGAYRTLTAQFEQQFKELPQAGPDIRGVRLEELEREYREVLEAIFHKHMPHTEVGETARIPVVVPGPGVR